MIFLFNVFIRFIKQNVTVLNYVMGQYSWHKQKRAMNFFIYMEINIRSHFLV